MGSGRPWSAGRWSVCCSARTARAKARRSARWSVSGLAGPPAGDQDAAATVTEVVRPVRRSAAGAGSQARPGVLGLDGVQQPVGAPRGARFPAQRFDQPGVVRPRGVGGRLVGLAQGLGQVLRQVPDELVRLGWPARTPWMFRRLPNRATCAGPSPRSAARSSASSHVGSSSPVRGSMYSSASGTQIGQLPGRSVR